MNLFNLEIYQDGEKAFRRCKQPLADGFKLREDTRDKELKQNRKKDPIMTSQGPISKSFIDEIKTPKRICFKTSHQNALELNDSSSYPYYGSFGIPFLDSFAPLLSKETGITIPKSRYGYWKPLNHSEYEKIDNFIKKVGTTVFLRDTLALSIALSVNFDEDNNRTYLGDLEWKAKYWDQDEATQKLSSACIDTINILPYYEDVDCFCAVPPSDNGMPNLPCQVIENIQNEYDIENITSNLNWRQPKNSLKNLSRDEKWAELEKAGLDYSGSLHGQSIILIDDLYQSGLTIQYVAKRLLEAGAGRIFGVCLVKSRRDTDNQ